MASDVKSLVITVTDMTCTNCENKIEAHLLTQEGVILVKAMYSRSRVHIQYIPEKITPQKIRNEIRSLNYTIGNTNMTKLSKQQEKLKIDQLLAVGIIILALYLILKHTGGLYFIPEVDASMSYGILFVVGILTSLHCVAMCGGISLSQSVAYQTDKKTVNKLTTLRPSILYNTGRVISYTLIGGIVGALGRSISFSGSAKGIVAILSGVFMIIMGLNMLNIFPWLRRLNPRMPKFIGNKLQRSKGNGPFYVGLLNGFMPCGPLQAMQLYALGTGSFIEGALSMFLFSLGTVPLMFVIGMISSLMSGKFTHKMLKVSAIFVMILGIVMANRGLSLSGISIFATNVAIDGETTGIATIRDNIQYVETRLEHGRYAPIVVEVGVPVEWNIKVEKGFINGCNNPIVIPTFGLQLKLTEGDNVVKFTPESAGSIAYSCWMGMIRGTILVVDDLDTLDSKALDLSVSKDAEGYDALPSCCVPNRGF